MKKSVSISLVLLSLLIIGFVGWWIYDSRPFPETMTLAEFEKLKEKQMEIIDTSVFLDEELEEWYFKKRQEEGEYLYHSNDSTYILISLGMVEDENTFLLLNGVRERNGRLLISYDTLQLKDAPEIEFEDDIRSTLIRVDGIYDSIKLIHIEEEA